MVQWLYTATPIGIYAIILFFNLLDKISLRESAGHITDFILTCIYGA